ncbi:MAG: hypothetical protein FWC50_15395 [Planctomycetaceae bacterium]|nr:hypothetical protein [Planctomycetaceae bacterium]
MLSNVGIICFAASYVIVLLLEISRFFFRSGVRGALMFGVAVAGWVAHTAYLYHQIFFQNGHVFHGVQVWLFSVAWVLVIIYLYLTVCFPKTPFGWFLMPLVLATIGVGTFLTGSMAFPPDSSGKIWRAVHGLSFLLVTVTIVLSFVLAIMYLVQWAGLKHKRPIIRGRFRLPTLEWLHLANLHLIGWLIVSLTVGIISGLVVNRSNIQQQIAPISIFDPMVSATILLFFFLVTFVIAARVWPNTLKSQFLPLTSAICFITLLTILAFGIFSSSAHWSRVPNSQEDNVKIRRQMSLQMPDADRPEEALP